MSTYVAIKPYEATHLESEQVTIHTCIICPTSFSRCSSTRFWAGRHMFGLSDYRSTNCVFICTIVSFRPLEFFESPRILSCFLLYPLFNIPLQLVYPKWPALFPSLKPHNPSMPRHWKEIGMYTSEARLPCLVKKLSSILFIGYRIKPSTILLLTNPFSLEIPPSPL